MWAMRNLILCSLRASCPGRSGGSGKRKESLQLRLWNLNYASNSPVVPRRLSCQFSANKYEAETSANEGKHWKTMASLLKSSPPISISHRPSRCRYSNSREVVASSSSLLPPPLPPAARTLRRPCSQAIFFVKSSARFLTKDRLRSSVLRFSGK